MASRCPRDPQLRGRQWGLATRYIREVAGDELVWMVPASLVAFALSFYRSSRSAVSTAELCEGSWPEPFVHFLRVPGSRGESASVVRSHIGPNQPADK